MAFPQKALAAPAGCVWDHDGVISVFTSPADVQGCQETFLSTGVSSVPNGSYWYIQDYRESETPCRNNSRVMHVTAEQFLTYAASQPTSSRCGTPPPPNIEDAAEQLPAADGGRLPEYTGNDVCGTSPGIQVSINIGCYGMGNAIIDAMFAIIRIMSYGVGLAIIASTIVAGLQYTSSRADPGAIAKATERLRNNVLALILYIFAYSILNWIIPGRLLN